MSSWSWWPWPAIRAQVIMPFDISGKYKLTKTDKFEEYMKAVGVGIIMRKLGASAVPIADIKKTGPDSFSMKSITTIKTSEINFKLGEPFKEETADGRVCQSVITWEKENVMKHEQNCSGMRLTMWREFTPTEMKMTLEAPGVTATRIYTKIE